MITITTNGNTKIEEFNYLNKDYKKLFIENVESIDITDERNFNLVEFVSSNCTDIQYFIRDLCDRNNISPEDLVECDDGEEMIEKK
jgi:hypothetical protein